MSVMVARRLDDTVVVFIESSRESPNIMASASLTPEEALTLIGEMTLAIGQIRDSEPIPVGERTQSRAG